MKREIDLSEISDGKLYTAGDMVKVGCKDCQGCSSCCHGMGDSIVLDPMDFSRLINGTGMTPEELLAGFVTLHVVDGIILPNLSMKGAEEVCPFLNQQNRCSIHCFRPGICRLFPLGRYYEDGTFRYFLQTKECSIENRTKVKIQKWLDVPKIKSYEKFIADWHYFLLAVEKRLEETKEEEFHKKVTIYLLQMFYLASFSPDTDFYIAFEARLSEAKHMLGLL